MGQAWRSGLVLFIHSPDGVSHRQTMLEVKSMETLHIVTLEMMVAGLILGAVLGIPVTNMLSKIFARF